MMVYVVYDKNEQCIGVYDYSRDACKAVGLTKASFNSQMSRGKRKFRNGTYCERVDIGDDED